MVAALVAWRAAEGRLSALQDAGLLPEPSIGDEAATSVDAERRALQLLDELEALVTRAKVMPLTHEARIKRRDVYDILDQMRLEVAGIRDERALPVLQQLDRLDERLHRARTVPFSLDQVRVKRERLDRRRTRDPSDPNAS